MNKEIKLKLIEISKKYDLDLLVLFGSRANDTYNKNSDYDLATYFNKELTEKNYFKLKLELFELLNCKKIDLIDLKKEEDLVLRYEILNNGICIYEKFEGIFDNFQTNSWFNYVYYKPEIDEQNNFVKNSLMEMVNEK